jgi:hypothetical protein
VAELETPFLADPEVPEGCIISAAVKITEYLDADGEAMYVYTRSTEVPYSNIIGLLDMVKHSLEHEADSFGDD